MKSENLKKLAILKKAKSLLYEGQGMCYALNEAIGGGFMSYVSIVQRFPEFKPRTFGARPVFSAGSYWWSLDIEGYQARLKAFDKLIEIYTEKCNNES